ncbi:glycosyltransferase family 50 protein [Durotheca rogersii]|uniref:glycosyltransferase family 50 protein n=1 Tax=Durotheca rogersii TaxID=419775 RepID=UPI00221F894E|nr:glycosyltransferase family 50 protein [Durotheca rogersii]KAI5859676.1 glycosyltransferase family 50 protein [Durotheca rogersii]
MASQLAALVSRPLPLFAAAAVLRAALLVYGLWQDAHSPLKYTDIDYLVFTDAARFAFAPSAGLDPGPPSPYARETYRYTPLLAWLLYPTAHPGPVWFSSGKVLFAAADLLAGYLVLLLLRAGRMPTDRACRYASIWLLNPMVATISTRGSSEGLLGVLVMALVWAVVQRRTALAGVLLGLGVHFKIYPFIYAPAIVWWMDAERMDAGADANRGARGAQGEGGRAVGPLGKMLAFVTPARVTLAVVSLATFLGLNLVMYGLYGEPFVAHTFLHHVTRIDHRHNFSPYNILLYLASARPSPAPLRVESVAFLPQLLLSTILIPLVGAKKDLPTTMLAQTFAFVTFNKVCTSQYFLWYMVLLPLYLPNSSLLRRPTVGLSALVLWVATQALWLQQAYGLEFLGLSTFAPGLWAASLAFFLANCWILGIIIGDIRGCPPGHDAEKRRYESS